MVTILTIGVYGFREEAFFEALQNAGVQVFCDIRWRRGVRGSEYAFANHKRLQKRLDAMGIVYLHHRELSPNPAIRQRQIDVDKTEKIAKRQRKALSQEFVDAYQEQVLSCFDPHSFISEMQKAGSVVALFCVEKDPVACHRSLLAERIRDVTGVQVEHLLP